MMAVILRKLPLEFVVRKVKEAILPFHDHINNTALAHRRRPIQKDKFHALMVPDQDALCKEIKKTISAEPPFFQGMLLLLGA